MNWTAIWTVLQTIGNLIDEALRGDRNIVVIDHTQPTATPFYPPPPTVKTAPTPLLTKFCLAIKEHEGWSPASRSYRNNNPGNCRYSSVGYLDIYKPVKRDPQNFAIFKDYATGWLYLTNLVRVKARAHPTQSIFEFFQNYAPASDNNNTRAYALFVAGRLGVDYLTWRLGNLL